MKIDETYRSFMTLQSLGINYGLLTFIAELNKTLAQIRQENRISRQYQLLSKIRDAALDVRNTKDMQDEKAGKLADIIMKAVKSDELLNNDLKAGLSEAFSQCVTVGRSCENEATFEDVLAKSSLDNSSREALLSDYRAALDKANGSRNDFYVYQLDVDAKNGAVIVGAVERQLRENGIPGVAFYDPEGIGKSFLHVFDADSAHYAKAFLENELCRRSLCNIRSDASLQAIAQVTRQKVYRYDGLTKAEAGKFYEQALGKGYPAYIDDRNGSEYCVEFLGKARAYAEKLLAEAIVSTNGYSKAAGLDISSTLRQNEREKITEFFAGIYSSEINGYEKADNLGYIIDTAENHEGHRIMIGKDSITEISSDGSINKIQRAANPNFYEDHVRSVIDNFSKDFFLIPGKEAEKLGLYNENFKITEKVRDYIRKSQDLPEGTKKPGKKELRDAAIECRFMSWAIRTSPCKTAADIFTDIRNHLEEKVESFKLYETGRIQKQLSAATQDEGNQKKAQEILSNKKASLEKDIDSFFKDNGNEFRTHLNEFSKRVQGKELEPKVVMPDAYTYSFDTSRFDSLSLAQTRDKMNNALNGFDFPADTHKDEPVSGDTGKLEKEQEYYSRMKKELITKIAEKNGLDPSSRTVSQEADRIIASMDASPTPEIILYSNLNDGAVFKESEILEAGNIGENR